jgi:hypothetical protein
LLSIRNANHYILLSIESGWRIVGKYFIHSFVMAQSFLESAAHPDIESYCYQNDNKIICLAIFWKMMQQGGKRGGASLQEAIV